MPSRNLGDLEAAPRWANKAKIMHVRTMAAAMGWTMRTYVRFDRMAAGRE